MCVEKSNPYRRIYQPWEDSISHFYGTVKGAGSAEATRRGYKTTVLSVTAASWEGAVNITFCRDKITGHDRFMVAQRPWKGMGVNKVLDYISEVYLEDLGLPPLTPEERHAIEEDLKPS